MDSDYVVEGLVEQNEVGMAQERDRDMLRAETDQSPLNFTPRLLKRKLLKKRARLLKEGQLTMIVHGADETRLWNHRVGMFQRNMRDVLGDRRKTFEWCGSVLDSVVGAFLTQNVSDLLSSRAYMELVSRWPSINKDYPNSDTVDWESVRKASHQDLADAIKCRGMQYNLSTNIKGFLESTRAWNLRRKHPHLETTFDYDVILVMNDMVDVLVSYEFSPRRDDIDSEALYPLLERDFGEGSMSLTKDAHCYTNTTHLLDVYTDQRTRNASQLLSLEWLRQTSGNEAHEFLMGIPGLGRKSVACIMLLALGMKEFPVDTNVGRICSRLGWIPLEAGHAIEDLDDYAPEPEVHAFLRSRLLKFPTDTLYELHYQMITLGKVFCSKSDPNCKACPMQSHCEYAENDGPSLHGRKRLKVWQYEDDIRVTTPQKTEKIKYSTDDGVQISYGAGGTGSTIVNIKHDWDEKDLPLEHLISLRSTRARSHRSVSRLNYVFNTMIEEMKTELCYLASQSLHSRMVPWIPVQLLRDCHSQEIRSIWDTLDEDELSTDLLTCLPTVPTEFNSTSSSMSIWDMEDIGNCSVQMMQAAKTYKYRHYACRANNFENAVAFSNLYKKNIDEVDLTREDIPKNDQNMKNAEMGNVDMVDAHQKGAKAPLSASDPVSEEKIDNVTDLDSLIENLNQFEAEMEAIESSPTAETVENGQDTSSNSPNPDNLSNLGLQILGITEEHKQNSQDNVLLLARQKYHYFARLLHPDKCKKTEAVGAFITLSKLIDVVSRGIQSPKHIDRPNEEIQKTLLLHAPGDLRSDACCNATETSYVKRELHNRLTWSQNRLVVLAYRMSREMQAPLVQRFSSATKGLLQSEKLIFLPLRNLPSINPYLKKEEMVGTITHEVSDLMQDILCAISGEKGDISSTLDGLLLVPSRSALEGRFPLNGTYFQINEVFLDQATVSNTIKVPVDLLSQCQETAIYFGLGIHYLTKGMSQEEVEDMFTDGLVCFRAYNPETKAPMPLPTFLTPNAPKNSKHVEKILQAKQAGYLPKSPRITTAMSRVPLRQASVLSHQRTLSFHDQALSLQHDTQRRRRYLFPAISVSRRCGHCKSCLNPSWKKACEVRRAEMLQALQPNAIA